MIFGRLLAVEVIMLILSTLTTLPSSTDVYPNPQQDVYRCGQGGRPSWICDPDRVLSVAEAEEVNAALDRLRQETKCPCSDDLLCSNGTRHGYSVAVAVMTHIPQTRTQVISAKSYAKYLREREWLYGNCQDDVVIVISKQRKQVAASVGETAALKLTTKIMEDILSNTRDFFQNDNFSQGLLEIIIRMRAAFQDDYAVRITFPVWTFVQMIMAAAVVLSCLLGMYLCKRLYS